jgi:phage gpG-like protein
MASVSGLRVTGGITGANMRGAGIEMFFEPSMVISAGKVDKLGLLIRSFREPLKRAVKDVMIPSIHKNFTVSGRPKWSPLAADTVLMKTYSPGLGYIHKPLIRTGLLQKTMLQQNIWHIDPERATIAQLPDKIFYGAIQQAGTSGGKTFSLKNVTTGRIELHTEGTDGQIPARPFVVVQEEDIVKIQEVFGVWLDERIAMAGL